MSNMTNVKQAAETVYPVEAPGVGFTKIVGVKLVVSCNT